MNWQKLTRINFRDFKNHLQKLVIFFSDCLPCRFVVIIKTWRSNESEYFWDMPTRYFNKISLDYNWTIYVVIKQNPLQLQIIYVNFLPPESPSKVINYYNIINLIYGKSIITYSKACFGAGNFMEYLALANIGIISNVDESMFHFK